MPSLPPLRRARKAVTELRAGSRPERDFETGDFTDPETTALSADERRQEAAARLRDADRSRQLTSVAPPVA